MSGPLTPRAPRGLMVRYGVAGVCAGLALAWSLGMVRAPEARAQESGARGEPGGTIAFTLPATTGGAPRLVLIEPKQQAFAVYRLESGAKGAIRLEAARQYRYDLMLQNYNNAEPAPNAIEAMVRSATR